MKEVVASNDVILFIDELHTLVGAGSAEGGVDAANILKPPLARGDLQCIGATTMDEYRKYIEKDAALERRFQPVNVPETTIDQTTDILRGLRGKYEAHHDVLYTEESLEAASAYSARYINDRFLPDKAIDLLDEAGSLVQLALFNASAAAGVEATPEVPREQGPNADGVKKDLVTEEDVANVVSKITGIPVQRLSSDESAKLMALETTIAERVVGQRDAVAAISRAVRRRTRRPRWRWLHKRHVEGRRVEGRRVEGRRVEGRRVEGRRVEGRRVEGRRVDGRHVEGRRVEGRRPTPGAP